MSRKQVYLAVDLGAGSGRVLAGEFDGRRIELHEIHRFENSPIKLPSGWHWNVTSLHQHILDGLKKAADVYGDRVKSLGVDTWGVDYALLDDSGKMLGVPYQYRDSRTDGMMERAFERVPKKKIYERTGIQFMFFNTLFQLLAEEDDAALGAAEDLVFMPDLFAYWLSGRKVQERSIASTSQLYNPKTADWDYDLIARLGLPKKLFKKIVDPGTNLGPVNDVTIKETGLKRVEVVSVAGHDTACAVAAVPSSSAMPAYISSGTWSLMGLELPEPVISQQSFEDGFTNEIGVGGTIRFLKNICGLWLIQECRRAWLEIGLDVPYGKMASMAGEMEPFRSLIDPDDPVFVEAGNMPERIQRYCGKTDQPVPERKGQIIRCIYESLALRYAQVWDRLVSYTENTPEAIHIVGGGCQDKLLNQFTANALGVPVLASPVEATGLGNIMAQLMADGSITSLTEGREIVANSSLVDRYEPEDSEAWKNARATFDQLTRHS